MSLQVYGNTINRVAIIDDQPDFIDAMAFNLEDADLEPVLKTEQIASIGALISELPHEADAAILDHHLTPGNYANFVSSQNHMAWRVFVPV
ncbi:MAG: hypothetical protein GY862_01225 [Gammaproteobacteria bacterium]|nr:hypothetical protein [Gammaproteobacteria bacterium]